MAKNNEAILLVSSPGMEDPIFHQSILFVAEQNSSGATGFIINKLHPRKLNDLAEFNYCKAWPLYFGGPVENEKIFFIHRRPDLIEGGIACIPEQDITKTLRQAQADSVLPTYLGGNFKQAIKYINDNTLKEDDIKLFVGYCGWDGDELEAEVEEGSWITTDAITDIFSKDFEGW